MSTKPHIDVHVRGIDAEVWQALRVEAVKQGWSVATLVQHMWFLWQEQQDRRG